MPSVIRLNIINAGCHARCSVYFIVKFNVVMLNSIMLSIMLSVVFTLLLC
jgi:hypothetical protein